MRLNLHAVTVKQLNTYVKSLLDGDVHLQCACVTGELSNFKRHYQSGHFYFTLKDADAAVRCVMFRSYASAVGFEPRDGMQVVVTGRVSLYGKDGQYQLYCEQLFAAGAGDLALKFEQLKEKLEKEGLFEQSRKKPLPAYPQRIAVVTSETGAAVQDVLNILGRRFPLTEVVLCPVSVQGDAAVPEMLDALDRLYRLPGTDVIIIGRGGGSAEDLWQFNDERLARKIYESPVPVISAVGHETDFTICDFVSDLRAPTPSAAAELAVPDREELCDRLLKYRALLKARLTAVYSYCESRFERLNSRYALKTPEDVIISGRLERVDRAGGKLLSLLDGVLSGKSASLGETAARLDALSPLKTLSRGYTAAFKGGSLLRSVNDVSRDDIIDIKFKDGTAVCRVTDKERIK